MLGSVKKEQTGHMHRTSQFLGNCKEVIVILKYILFCCDKSQKTLKIGDSTRHNNYGFINYESFIDKFVIENTEQINFK